MSARRVFLTGGTGFVGAHLARRLADRGWAVVVLTRDARRVPPELEQRVEIVQGDLAASWKCPIGVSALHDCDALVHCAKSDDTDPMRRAERDFGGTAQLVAAAAEAGVRRFVHLSTISSYGATPDGIVDESFPRVAPRDLYGRTKLNIEEEVLGGVKSIEIVVLQPGNVYGPGKCWWGQGVLDLMRRGKVLLVNDGAGIANMVHVFDVVQAVEKALDTPSIAGERFLIIDGQPISWRQYYEGLERIVGRSATVSIPAAEARSLSHSLQNRSLPARTTRWLGRTFLGRPIVFPLSDDAIDGFCRKTIFSIDKARCRLGYDPQFGLAEGLDTLA